MPVARKQFEHTVELSPDFRHLVLQDLEHPDLRPGTRTGLHGEVGSAGTGMIQFFCLGQMPAATVHVELWTAAPGEGAGRDTDFEAEFETRHEVVHFNAVSASPDDFTVHLPHAGRYRVRAWRTPGQPRSHREVPEIMVEPEDWLVQMWPA